MSQDQIAQVLRVAFLAARDLDAPLNDRLNLYSGALKTTLPAYASAADRLVARLLAAGSGSAAPLVGEQLPPFLLPDEDGRLVGLEEELRDGPIAVVFMRGHWCPYCRMTAHALARIDDQIRPSGSRIVVLTPERQQFTRQLKSDAGARFRVLSDIANSYAFSLNLVVWLGDEIQQALSQLGRDLSVYQTDSNWFVPIPATFVVSRDGIISARFIDPDYRRRVECDALIAAVVSAH